MEHGPNDRGGEYVFHDPWTVRYRELEAELPVEGYPVSDEDLGSLADSLRRQYAQELSLVQDILDDKAKLTFHCQYRARGRDIAERLAAEGLALPEW